MIAGCPTSSPFWSPLQSTLGQLSEALAQVVAVLLKGLALLISLGLELLLSPRAKVCAFPGALLTSYLVIICRSETEPLLFGLQPKCCLFSWCNICKSVHNRDIGNRSTDFISSLFFFLTAPANSPLSQRTVMGSRDFCLFVCF